MVDDHFERIKIADMENRARRKTASKNIPNPIGVVTSDAELSSKIGTARFETERDRSRSLRANQNAT